jgi:hypothetical protein
LSFLLLIFLPDERKRRRKTRSKGGSVDGYGDRKELVSSCQLYLLESVDQGEDVLVIDGNVTDNLNGE